MQCSLDLEKQIKKMVMLKCFQINNKYMSVLHSFEKYENVTVFPLKNRFQVLTNESYFILCVFNSCLTIH